jgi:hypothetical protein
MATEDTALLAVGAPVLIVSNGSRAQLREAATVVKVGRMVPLLEAGRNADWPWVTA